MPYRFELDCQDNNCEFDGKGRGGMRTNGGCRCLDLPFKQRMGLRRFIREKDAEIERLGAAREDSGVWTITEDEFRDEIRRAENRERDACAKIADRALRACVTDDETAVATTIRNLILTRSMKKEEER